MSKPVTSHTTISLGSVGPTDSGSRNNDNETHLQQPVYTNYIPATQINKDIPKPLTSVASSTAPDKSNKKSQQQDRHKTTHNPYKSRPLPKVNESDSLDKISMLPKNLASPESEPKSSNRLVYMDVPQKQHTDLEDGIYNPLKPGAHGQDELTPVISGLAQLTNLYVQNTLASKKRIQLAVCLVLVGLIIVLVALLITFFVSRNQLNNNFNNLNITLDDFNNIFNQNFNNFKDNFNAKHSSLLQLIEMNTKLLASLQNNSKKELIDNIKYGPKTSNLTVTYLDSCYCLYRQILSWNSAREFCLNIETGGHLAEIYQKNVNDFLTPLLNASNITQSIWLGGSNLINHTVWMWEYRHRPLEVFNPSQWGPSQPSNSVWNYETEHCLEMNNRMSFKWNDAFCSNFNLFLCKSSFMNGRCAC